MVKHQSMGEWRERERERERVRSAKMRERKISIEGRKSNATEGGREKYIGRLENQ